jgi:hypothetical protein
MAGEATGAARAFLGQGLGMGWGDEAEAWLRSKLGGGEYDSELENIRNEYARYSAKHPMTAGGLEFVGGAAPGIAAMAIPGMQPAGIAALAPTVGKLSLGALGKMAGIGSTMGMISGAGSAEEGQRLSGASTGGMLGTVLGGAAPVAARTLGALGRWAAERTFPTEKRIASRAAGKFNTALEESGMAPRDIPLSLQSDRAMGVPSVIANLSPGLVDLAETVAQRTGSGARKIEETLNRQKTGTRERTHGQVVKAINPGNYYEDEQRLVKDLRNKASGLYDAAYAHGEITDPRIMAALDTPAFKAAFQKAKQISETEMATAKLRGEDPSKFALRDIYYPKEVKPGVFELELKTYPDVRTLDYLKRGIDANVDAGFRNGQTAEASALRGMRRSFVDIIDDQVPAYKAARAEYGGDMEVIDAMRAGMNDFNKMDHEQVMKMVAGMSTAEKDAFRTGVARDLYSTIMKPSGNFNAAQRVIGSPEMQAKLQPLFDSPAHFRLFKTALERESQLFIQANRILGGSPTGKRLQMSDQFEGDPGAGEAIATAITGGFGSSLLGLASRAVRKTQVSEKTASKLADMLMSTDPHDVATVVRLLEQQAESVAPRAFKATAGTAGAVTGTEAAFWPSPEDKSAPAADIEADLRSEVPGAQEEVGGADIEADIEKDLKARP